MLQYSVSVLACFQMTSDELFEVYKGFISNYPVVSIEDAFDQDDWPAWTKMNAAISIQLVGSVFYTVCMSPIVHCDPEKLHFLLLQ